MAYANTKMDKVNEASTSLVMLNSALIDVKAGAIMLEEIGETRVKEDTMNVAAHFRFIDLSVQGKLSVYFSDAVRLQIALPVFWIRWVFFRIPCYLSDVSKNIT